MLSAVFFFSLIPNLVLIKKLKFSVFKSLKCFSVYFKNKYVKEISSVKKTF